MIMHDICCPWELRQNIVFINPLFIFPLVRTVQSNLLITMIKASKGLEPLIQEAKEIITPKTVIEKDKPPII